MHVLIYSHRETPAVHSATVGAGAYEIRVRDVSGAYRTIYVAKSETAVYVLHAFQKKTQQTAKMDRVGQGSLQNDWR